MPREKINGTDRDGYNVQIGWHPNAANVQFGVETGDGRSLLTMLYGSEPNLERIGRAAADRGWPILEAHDSDAERDARIAVGREVLDIVQGGTDRETPDAATAPWAYSSVWARLDRHGCNRLIRLVRRARDAAFGADE